MKTRYLSKSRFKLGHECPTKLYYTGKKEYANSNDEDEFLKALAEGGYQVGELAKLYYPGGTEPNERDYQKAHDITVGLLKSDIPSVYEASIIYQNLFVRVDVLSRTSKNSFDLIEVKAKSFDTTDDEPFWNKVSKKKGIKELKASWEAYLYDVAFQTYVARHAFPEYVFTPYLLLADKNKEVTVDGLNQLFPISKINSQTIVGKPSVADSKILGDKILVKIDVSDVVDFIINESKNDKTQAGFKEYVEKLAGLYEKGEKAKPEVSKDCKGCEFYGDKSQLREGLKSGFHECWKEAFKTDDKTLEQDLVTDLWYFLDKNTYLRSNIFLLKDLPDSAIDVKESEDGAMTRTERQALQLKKVKVNDLSVYQDLAAIKEEMDSWTYPLHFIDFETMTVAIPFHKNQRPYESIAFQFSHHQMEKDGSYHHKTEYLHSEPGIFPNFEFVRALKNAIGNDKGTIFRYTSHENSILNQIHKQLTVSNEPDKASLIVFLESITSKKGTKTETARTGSRNMVDLFKIYTNYYYDPTTHGSNSLKATYPAALRRSKYLQEKYSKPIYGTEIIKSLNFKDKTWISKDKKSEIINPYYTLPPIFEGLSFDVAERMFGNDELREGGSASVAFARLQFEKMTDVERKAIRAALLRYCELDTLAMVMIVEHWRELAL